MGILNWELFLEEVVGENPISNLQSYIQGMGKSMEDKLFFSDLINYDVLVDFGCADGTFLKGMLDINPNLRVIGYDIDESMLDQARLKLDDRAILTDNWDDVINSTLAYKNPVLNLGSVIHEVYSYSSTSTVRDFWNNQVFGGDFKYITIRDMIPSVQMDKNEINHFKDDARKVREKSNKLYLDSFEQNWGSINSNYRTLIHYLLKYRYTNNWEREVHENYLPVSLETIKSKIPSRYKVVYEKSYILPFLKEKVKKDFGIDLTHSIYTKMIIKNSSFKR